MTRLRGIHSPGAIELGGCWEVKKRKLPLGLWRTFVVWRQWSIWLSRNLDDAYPSNRWSWRSVCAADARAEWARLNPRGVVILLGDRWQRRWRCIYERDFAKAGLLR